MVVVDGPALQQLSTRPVIGFREVRENNSPTSTAIYYVEAGTGHLYRIDLATGVEERRSGTTVREAAWAEISPDGRHIAYLSGYGSRPALVVGTVASDTPTMTLTNVSTNAGDIAFTTDGSVVYTETDTTLTGRRYNLGTQTSETLFTLPFRDATVRWGTSTRSAHLVFPRPSHLLPGYLYLVSGGTLNRLPHAGYGVAGMLAAGFVVQSEMFSETLTTSLYDLTLRDAIPLNLPVLPEKCVGSERTVGRLWCAVSDMAIGYGFPDTWYRGEVSARDTLYEFILSPTSTETINLIDLSAESGRDHDIIRLRPSQRDDAVYFINRTDNSLWRYRLTP
jgi:hypothetical protein